jgi:hypothetical protein
VVQIAGYLAVGRRDLERLPKDILVPVLGCRSPFVGANPSVDLRWLDFICDPFAESIEDKTSSCP